MIPSLDDRLDSVMRALQEVILPALPPDRALAVEQAHLSLAQLSLIREQLDLVPLFERHEAQALIGLADELVKTASGGDVTMTAAEDLRTAMETAALDTPKAVRAATQGVGAAIKELIDASLKDGDDTFLTSSMQAVLVAGRASAMRNRSWNRSAGFEASGSGVRPVSLS